MKFETIGKHMYEFHCWITLRESMDEIDIGTLDAKVESLRERIAQLNWTSAVAEVFCSTTIIV
jgi:hypothetical protein